MLTYRRTQGVPARPATSTAAFFGDSLSDPQVSKGGSFQGGWRALLCTRFVWVDVNPGAAPANAVLGTPVSNAGHQVTSVPVTTAGSGYPSNSALPAVTITGGTFTVQATAHAVLGADGSVASIVVDSGGTYTVNATGATIAAAPVNAAATSTQSGGAITGLTGVTAGNNYPAWGASATFAGGGTGAFYDICTVSGGGITGLSTAAGATTFNNGSGYSAGAVTFSKSNDHARGAIASTTMIDNTALPGGVDPGVLTYPLRLTNANAQMVFIFYGTNDLNTAGNGAGYDVQFNPTNFSTAYQTVLTAVKAQSSAPTIVCIGLPPLHKQGLLVAVPSWATSKEDAERQYNDAIHELAISNGGAYVNLQGLDYATMAAITGDIHLNALGQVAIRERVTEALQGL